MKFSIQTLKKLKCLVKSETGGTLAELALTVPFLALMLAGVTEFGRYFQTYTTLAKATRSAARYVSNHNINQQELDRAVSLVVCGKLACAGGDELVKGVGAGPAFGTSNVCIETTGSPPNKVVTVRIARTSNCNPIPNAPAGNPYIYQPIFDLGALLGSPTFTLALPISPNTTMLYMN